MRIARVQAAWVVLATGLALPGVASAQRTVYLNLEQQAINTNSGNDPSLNSYSSNSFMPGTVDGYPALDDDQRAELMHWFKHATVPFDIHFTYDRPAVGNFDMLVFGSEADNGELFPDLGCSASIGLADCTDTDDENISFMFWGCMPDNQQMDLRRVAFFGLTALGFGWGLEGVGVSGQVMGSYTQTGLEFGDSCVAISGGGGQCTHAGCNSGQQNSSADLTPAVGNRIDDGPPTVTIETPANLAIVDSNVTVVAAVEDTFGGVSVVLEIVEAAQSLDDDVPPHNWDLSNIPDGMWTLRVTATDADDNITTQEVVVCVGLTECGGAAEGGGESSTGGADETTTAAAGSSEDEGGQESSTGDGESSSGGGAVSGVGSSTVSATAGGSGFGNDAAGTGCGCRSGSGRGGGGWLVGWAAAALGFVVRRRR